MTFKQAPRTEKDGQISVSRMPNERDTLVISVTHDGVQQALTLSEHNASRIFGLLSMMLEIPLSKAVGKAIKL
jgi:hypothetical protein